MGIRRVCFAVRDSGQALGARTREKGDAITLEPLRPRTFDRTSPVTAYWLTRCDGFRVAGTRGLATVEGTVFDDDPLHPVALRVRRGAKGTRLISIDAVEAVCPIERVLYLRRRPSAASRAAVGISALGPHGRRAARRTGGGVATAWRFGAPRARAASRATAGAARRKWPAVVQGAVFVVQGAYVLALVLQALVVAAAVAAGRLIRHGLLAARRLAPRGARLVSAGWRSSQLGVFPAEVTTLLGTRSHTRSNREEIGNDVPHVGTDPVPLER